MKMFLCIVFCCFVQSFYAASNAHKKRVRAAAVARRQLKKTQAKPAAPLAIKIASGDEQTADIQIVTHAELVGAQVAQERSIETLLDTNRLPTIRLKDRVVAMVTREEIKKLYDFYDKGYDSEGCWNLLYFCGYRVEGYERYSEPS